MNAYSLPPDTETLLCVAESVAWVLADRQEELGLDADAEALLRASIAAATFGIHRYLEPRTKSGGRGSAAQPLEMPIRIAAEVAEVSVAGDGQVRVHRVVCAVDCGWAVHSDSLKAQMEGGIVFGLTAALKGEITVKNGRVQQATSIIIKCCECERCRRSKSISCRAPRHPGEAENRARRRSLQLW